MTDATVLVVLAKRWATDLLFLKGAAPHAGRGVTVRWLYYVVENAWVVRVSDDWVHMEILQADGSWLRDTDIGWVQTNGRRVASEDEALEEAREIFDLRGVQHTLGPSRKAKGQGA